MELSLTADNNSRASLVPGLYAIEQIRRVVENTILWGMLFTTVSIR
jgi:hypothetical protein